MEGITELKISDKQIVNLNNGKIIDKNKFKQLFD